LKTERAMRGSSQDALEAAAGLARITVADIETDRFKARADTRAKIARTLGLEVEDLWASP
jgi:DNA-binding XRE family transcriptional regulator